MDNVKLNGYYYSGRFISKIDYNYSGRYIKKSTKQLYKNL